jgi:thioredoxin reductase/SAM-dependent methyltransferase
MRTDSGTMTQKFDVAVLGGGAAGLSGAVILGRARRSVVVIDAGAPRNAPAEGVHGFLSRDGISPLELVEIGRTEVKRYGGLVLPATAVAARPADDGFEVSLDDGRAIAARRLLVTTGLADELPGVTGLAERWGRDVVHCPYCHGWELSDQPVGVLATNTEWAVHQALLFRQLTADVILFQHTAPALTHDQSAQLNAWGISVVTGPVDSLEVTDDRITGLRLADGTVVARSAVVVAPRLTANTKLLTDLGLEATPHPMGIGQSIAADPTGLTNVPGVWVAGNVTDLMAQVVSAAAGGVAAAAAINADLIAEDTRRTMHMLSRDFWEERYGSAERVWSGNPNPQLVATAADLPPRTALDVGSGEGADAIWLAARGWQVTGIDIATTALDRAAARAREEGLDVAWQQLDLTRDPAPTTYDLVSAFFLHLPAAQRRVAVDHLVTAVAPGGTLLVVGHDPSDMHTGMHRPGLAEMGWTADELAASLGDRWIVDTCGARPRQAVDHEGNDVTIHDAVLPAHRTG